MGGNDMETTNLFTYGSLSIPRVMKALTGKIFKTINAVAYDYACFLLKDKPYPGMIYSKNDATKGLLYVGVDELSLRIISSFEDDIYERREIKVISNNGEVFQAVAYVVPVANCGHVTRIRWNKRIFVEKFLKKYMSIVRTFRRKWPKGH